MGTTKSSLPNQTRTENIVNTSSVDCAPCTKLTIKSTAVSFCIDCKDFYCQKCVDYHSKIEATKSHSFAKIVDYARTFKEFLCDVCPESTSKARYICVECRQLYCIECAYQHRNLDVTQNHPILLLKRNNVLTETELHAMNNEVSFLAAQGPSTRRQVNDQTNVSAKQWTAAFHSEFSIRTPSDGKECALNRMITMLDGSIVVLDTHNGFKNKLFSETYKLLDEIQCKSCRAVTCVDDDTIKVIAADEIVTYIVVGNKLKEKQRIQNRLGRMFDIAYRKDDVILRYAAAALDCVSYGDDIIREERVLITTDFIHYDSCSDRLLVVNSTLNQNKIKCYDLNKKSKWELSIKGGTRGVIVVHGWIFVAMVEYHTVRQLDLNGTLHPDPLLTSEDGIENPTTLAYQEEQRKLLVGYALSDTVKVFNLVQP